MYNTQNQFCRDCINAHGRNEECKCKSYYEDLTEDIESLMVKYSPTILKASEPFKKDKKVNMPFYIGISCDWYKGADKK